MAVEVKHWVLRYVFLDSVGKLYDVDQNFCPILGATVWQLDEKVFSGLCSSVKLCETCMLHLLIPFLRMVN